jgi:hypothetical protein
LRERGSVEARSLKQQLQNQPAARCADCDDCGRRERRGGDREGRGAEVAEVAEVAVDEVGEVGLKRRAWQRGSSCRRWGSVP